MAVPTPETQFTRDILGNYVCNTLAEATNSGQCYPISQTTLLRCLSLLTTMSIACPERPSAWCEAQLIIRQWL